MLGIDDKAYEFNLPNQNNENISLTALKDKKIVLYFYPKDNTPGCTRQAIDFSELKEEFEQLNTTIIGISQDSCISHANFIKKHNLTIELVSDPEKIAIQAFGVWQEKINFGKKYMGISRTTFIIDETGKILKRWKNVKVDGHATKVLEFIKKAN
jgi:peroxiredoxin Q/BCP